MQIRHVLCTLVLLTLINVFSPFAFAQFGDDGLADAFGDEPEFLPVEEAFQFDFEQEGDQLVIKFDIADGYYLYKKQFTTKLKNVELGDASFPKAVQIEDDFFGISDVFYGELRFAYPVVSAKQDGVVALRYQGCAEAGLCYPPTIKQIYLNEVAAGLAINSNNAKSEDTETQTQTQTNSNASRSSQFDLVDRLAGQDEIALTLLLFLGFGLLLAFTPCVFPMYPILSGIVIGQGKDIKLSRAFWLSFVYVQGMAITYSVLGLVVASAGVQFQAALQHPVLLSIFIALFLLLALAMFGVYEIQMPSSWHNKLNNASNKQKSGSVIGVFVMGVLSGLVASPCTTAPLTAILLYIAQSGDLFLGFIALYVLSIGMGIPLILFGMTGGKLLPKAGAWMNVVKVTFGFMMIAVAIIFVERLWNSELTVLFYSALGLSAFSYYFVANADTQASFAKGARTLVIFVGLFASAMSGYSVIAKYLPGANHTNAATTTTGGKSSTHPEFVVVKDLKDFEQKLAAANAEGKTVMVDLYADWCVACKEFEKYTFPNAQVVEALSNTVWMQIDLTHNTPTNLAFQDHFDILGLPTILFFNENGKEISQSRVTGFMKAKPFAEHAERIL